MDLFSGKQESCPVIPVLKSQRSYSRGRKSSREWLETGDGQQKHWRVQEKEPLGAR